VELEGFGKLKNVKTSMGIDPATFQLVVADVLTCSYRSYKA
jgi:hypothetical protein